MNKRISELLAQCQAESIDGPEYPRWTDQEKFAELIVKECARLVDEHYDPHEPWMDGSTVLKHFGVEE